MSPPPETWFDRLSAPHTRRQSLRATAAAAAAAVGLPLAGRLPEAEAATPTDCRKGCVWTVNQRFTTRQRVFQGFYAANAYAAQKAFGPVLGYIVSSFWGGKFEADADLTWRLQRKEMQTCFQPYCPGFDPHAPGGPCDGCDPPLFCNPCELVESGYICCIYEPSDCHGDCCHPSPGCP